MSAKLDLKESLKRNLNENPFGEIPTMARDLLSSVPKKIKLSQETKANLPSQRSIEAALYRERELSALELPNSLAELVLEGKCRMTNDNLEFLLIEDGIEDKILVFGTILELQKLCGCDVVFMDGTFHSAPSIFAQNYIIHGICLGQMVPLLWALLPDKATTTYERLLSLIKKEAERIGLAFSPKAFQIDFEIAVINAIAILFPYAIIIKWLRRIG